MAGILSVSRFISMFLLSCAALCCDGNGECFWIVRVCGGVFRHRPCGFLKISQCRNGESFLECLECWPRASCDYLLVSWNWIGAILRSIAVSLICDQLSHASIIPAQLRPAALSAFTTNNVFGETCKTRDSLHTAVRNSHVGLRGHAICASDRRTAE